MPHITIEQIETLPYDIIYYIKNFLPISLLKHLRKINENELPNEYFLLKQEKEDINRQLIDAKFKVTFNQFDIELYKGLVKNERKKIQDSFKPGVIGESFGKMFDYGYIIDNMVSSGEKYKEIYDNINDKFNECNKQIIKNYGIVIVKNDDFYF